MFSDYGKADPHPSRPAGGGPAARRGADRPLAGAGRDEANSDQCSATSPTAETRRAEASSGNIWTEWFSYDGEDD